MLNKKLSALDGLVIFSRSSGDGGGCKKSYKRNEENEHDQESDDVFGFHLMVQQTIGNQVPYDPSRAIDEHDYFANLGT